MAIYHLTASTGSRSSGQSAAAKSEYLTRRGRYRRDADAVRYVESANMPAWAQGGRGADRGARYWLAADRYERANGRLFKQLEFALPRELDADAQLALAQAFARQVAGDDLPYTLALHDDPDSRNPHAHLMISERVNDGHDRDAQTWFRRYNPKDASCGGAQKTERLKPKQWLEQTRERWQEYANDALVRAGVDQQIDHRSYAVQQRERVPEPKVGVHGPRYQIDRRQRLRVCIQHANHGDSSYLVRAYRNTIERGIERSMIGRAVVRAHDEWQRVCALVRERTSAQRPSLADLVRGTGPRTEIDPRDDDDAQSDDDDADAHDDDDAEWHPSM